MIKALVIAMTQTGRDIRREQNDQPTSVLLPLSEVTGYHLVAEDDELGRISDILIDERDWAIRYFVVDIGSWLTGRRVVLDSSTFKTPLLDDEEITVQLTRQQIENGPTLAEHETVSQKHQRELSSYYGWPAYWETGLGGMTGTLPAAVPPMRPRAPDEAIRTENETGKRSPSEKEEFLRSFKEMKGYSIEARDDSVGHIEDMMTDSSDWMVRYLIVDTRNWLPGKKVMVAIHWLKSVSFLVRSAAIDLTKEQIKSAPEYDPKHPVDRDYEERLHSHYGLPGYWL